MVSLAVIAGAGLVASGTGDAQRLLIGLPDLYGDVEAPMVVNRALALRRDRGGVESGNVLTGEMISDSLKEAPKEQGSLAVCRVGIEHVRDNLRQPKFVGAADSRAG